MADPYATQVLTEDRHDRLVSDIDRIAKRSGVAKTWIWTAVNDLLPEHDKLWLRQVKKHAQDPEDPRYGLRYTPERGGDMSPEPVQRMMAMTGCLIRNFMDAQLMTVQGALTTIRKEGAVTATVLLIPNFFVAKESDKEGGWKAQALSDLLDFRIAEGLQTVVFVDDMDVLRQRYGKFLYTLLMEHYILIQK